MQCVRAAEGWRAYIPAAYNASSGGHEINITVNGETITRTLTVLPKDFGTVEVEAEEPASESANAQFRSAIWPLYEAAVTAKQWQGAPGMVYSFVELERLPCWPFVTLICP